MLYLILYLLNGIVTIFAGNAGYTMLMYSTKVLMMPLLVLYLYQQSGKIKRYRFIYLALFFSWLGDIFLMFPRDAASPSAMLLFICGLLAFLTGHLNYILHFINEAKSKKKATIIVEKPYLVVPFLLYVFLLLKLLFPTLGDMKLPVILYGLVITFMLLTAFNRKNLVAEASFYVVFVGAVLFILSDSCIAINLFYKPFGAAGILIMSTYIAAQLCIVKGILINKETIA